eukprot:5928596-Amphidinium_carterae.1
MEVINLTVGDLAVDALRLSAVVKLRATKTSLRSGIPESVVIDHPSSVALLLAASVDRRPECNFTGLCYHEFYKLLRECMTFFGLSDRYIRPHSFRRGGATHAWAMSNNLDFVTQKGRWGSQRTARIYLADGSCERVRQALSATHRRSVQTFADLFHVHCGLGQMGKRGVKRHKR